MAKVVIVFRSTCTLDIPADAEYLRDLDSDAILTWVRETHDLSAHEAEETYVDDVTVEE